MTQDELTQLEQTFSELKRNNEILLGDSTQSQKDLIRALSLLKESQAELQRLQDLLKALKAESAQAKDDLSKTTSELQKANESFRIYASEMKTKVRKEQIKGVVGAIIGIGVGYIVGRAFHN